MSYKEIKIKAKEKLKNKYFKYFLLSLLAFLLCIEIKLNFSVLPDYISIIQLSYIMVLVGIFIRPLYIMGVKKTYLYEDFSHLTTYFKKGGYQRKIWYVFLGRRIIVLFSFFLLIVPGIYKALEYIFMPYIFLENDDKSPGEILAESSMITKGKKLMLFKFVLSFSGWYILGFLCFGVGILFVNPYFEMSLKELYLKLKKNTY